MDAIPLTKICTTCPEGQQVKPITAFHVDKSRRDGLNPYCKVCVNAKSQRSKKKRLLEQVAAGLREMPAKRRDRQQALAAGEKECSQCEAVKSLDDFYEWERSPDGRQSECKDCHNGRNTADHPRDQSMLEKPCTKCGEPKLAEEFYDNPYAKDGMDSWCKECRKTDNAAWNKNNPDKRKPIANRSFKKAYADPEKRAVFAVRVDEWREDNPDRVKQHRRTDLAKNGQKPARVAKRRSARKQWFEDRPGYRAAASHKRRALIKQAPIVDDMINVWVLYKRDHGICTLCTYPVDKMLKWPDLRIATIDHAIPVTRGGEHSYVNTKLAHHCCNTKKNNRFETPQLLAAIRKSYEEKFLTLMVPVPEIFSISPEPEEAITPIVQLSLF